LGHCTTEDLELFGTLVLVLQWWRQFLELAFQPDQLIERLVQTLLGAAHMVQRQIARRPGHEGTWILDGLLVAGRKRVQKGLLHDVLEVVRPHDTADDTTQERSVTQKRLQPVVHCASPAVSAAGPGYSC